MMLFWAITAAMILAALVFIAPSLLRSRAKIATDRDRQNVVIARERLAELEAERDQGRLSAEAFELSRQELEQSLLLDLEQKEAGPGEAENDAGKGRWALATVAVLVPALTLGLYLKLGTPELIEPGPAATTSAHGAEGELPSVEQMMGALIQRLDENPEDSEGWFLLGRTYLALKEYANASAAFERVHGLVGDEPAVLLAWADAAAMQQRGNLSGKPAELVRKAVQLAPNNATALWLAGMVEEQLGDPALAVSYWERLVPQLQGDPQSSTRVATLIERAKAKLGAGPEPAMRQPAAEQVSAASEAAGGKAVRLRVVLSPELAGRAGPDEQLFVYARALQGPRMPLAAARHKVSDLPLELTLDDSGAMLPQMKISNFDQVVVGARVSRSGGAIARSGDLRGEVSPVTVGADGRIEIVIDTVVE
ncbi:MAG: c-type cytochrome biogenesis protein CcmI [Gammaproteobacteria bacterium]|nr:c-type cytochrome biogenesis protein CcmI [Gammaproteobacteria bacterium]